MIISDVSRYMGPAVVQHSYAANLSTLDTTWGTYDGVYVFVHMYVCECHPLIKEGLVTMMKSEVMKHQGLLTYSNIGALITARRGASN